MRTTHAFVAGLFGLGACYQEYQPSTTPAPQFQAQPVAMQGPPGGQIDPGYGYRTETTVQYGVIPPTAAPAGPEPSDEPGDADDAAEPGDGELVAPGDPDDPNEVDAYGAAPSIDPQGPVTDAEIEVTLEPYGYWVEDDEYGRIWRPDATVVGVDFTPYETCGTWVWTDYGWTFNCDWQWGWLPFHYGYWGWFDDYWGWVPDYTWSPGWVEWRSGGGYVGWRPIGPRVRDHRGSPSYGRTDRGPIVRDHRGRRNGDADWRFVADRDFGNGRRIRPSLVHNNAEGLRTTSLVPRPPIRAAASATTNITHVMKHRVPARTVGITTTSGGRPIYNPSRPMPTFDRARPTYGNGTRAPSGTNHTYQPSGTSPTPLRGYDRRPPSRTYDRVPTPSSNESWQQVRPHDRTPPSGASRESWQQVRPHDRTPTQSWTRQPSSIHVPPTPPPPSRTYSPSRTDSPAPSRSWSPSTSPAPSRSWSPSPSPAPARSWSPSPSSAGARSYSPSSPAPSRSYSPSPSSAGARSYSPSSPAPSRSYSPPPSSSSTRSAPSSSASPRPSSSYAGGARRR